MFCSSLIDFDQFSFLQHPAAGWNTQQPYFFYQKQKYIFYLERALSNVFNQSSTRRQLAKFINFKMFFGPAAKYFGPVNKTGPGGWEMLI